MTSSNLGIVFGPTLMRPRPTDATISLSSLVDYPHQARIIEALIIFYSTIFENNETTVLADSSKFGTGGEEAASCSDLVGAPGEGSTLGGCGAAQGSLEPLSWGSPSRSPNAPRAPPPCPSLMLCPAECPSDVPRPCCAVRGHGSGQRCGLSLRKPTLLPRVPACIPTPLASDFSAPKEQSR